MPPPAARPTAPALAKTGDRAIAAIAILTFVLIAPPGATAESIGLSRFDGFNVVASEETPFGTDAARLSLSRLRSLGARAIAVIPFLWQQNPASPQLARGNDMSDAQLAAAIHDAHALGLSVIVKPQIWVPNSWAGAVAMKSEDDWRSWFAAYRRELIRIAAVASDGHAEALAIGTELIGTSRRPEWLGLIAVARDTFQGRLLYAAHNIDEAEAVPFWGQLDDVGVTLYPPLGADNDRDNRRRVMRFNADHLEALSARTGRAVVVGEIGLRSAVGAAARPWESPEERASAPDPALQSDVLADWLTALDRPTIEGVLIWRWLTDPSAGGLSDTDFTVQGKPAERVLACKWTAACMQQRIPD